jgi:hypothetical protein
MASLSLRRAAVLLGASACGPSVTTLVAQHRWDESLHATRSAADARAVVPAIVAAHAARVHAHVITADEVGLQGTDAGDLFAQNSVLAVDTRFDGGEGTVRIMQAGGAPSLYGLQSVAATTHETIPTSHEEQRTTLTPDAVNVWGLAVLTLGLSLPFDNRKTTRTDTVSVPPTEAEVRKAAPKAIAIWARLSAGFPNQATFILPHTNQTALLVVVELSTEHDRALIQYEVPVDLLRDDWVALASTRWTHMEVDVEDHHRIEVEPAGTAAIP